MKINRVQVSPHYRNYKGKRVLVRTYNRNVKSERGVYKVPYLRQLSEKPQNNIPMDLSKKAKKPGFRHSPSGGYYERRFNRSDEDTYL